MGTILENHTLHIVNEDKTSEKLTGVMIQVNDIESVFHVRTAKKCSIPPVIKSVCAFDNMCKIKNKDGKCRKNCKHYEVKQTAL
jgi:hypothetical protein